MNFNYHYFFVLVLCTFFLSSCGVKSPPKAYDEISIPAYIESYTKDETNNSPPIPTVNK